MDEEKKQKNSELVKQLKELNKNFKEFKESGKHMVYSASPGKFIFFNFLSGIFHSLGSLFAYVVIFGILAYVMSYLNLPGIMSGFLEKTLDNVNWNKIMPAPKMEMPEGTDLQKIQDSLQLDIKDLEIK